MTDHSTEISVAACHAALPELLAGLAVACAQLAVAADDALRLQLFAEELFINTVDHGFSGKTGAPVRLSLSRAADGLRLHYSDAAPPFDPLAAPLPEAPGDNVGGLGLSLLRGMSRELHYRREAGRNLVELLL